MIETRIYTSQIANTPTGRLSLWIPGDLDAATMTSELRRVATENRLRIDSLEAIDRFTVTYFANGDSKLRHD